jgi:hypothetical protein
LKHPVQEELLAAMVNVGRLAAIDLSGLGAKFVIPEFAIAVLGRQRSVF